MIFIAFLGGLLTILSPCILPILPFLLAQSQGINGAKRSGLLLFLLGLVLMFTLVASLSTLSSHWIIQANILGRAIALGLLTLFALTLLSPRINHWVMLPFTLLGNRLTHFTERMGVMGSIVLGMATGLLWAPCAGPILGLILSSAMLQGNSVNTTALLWAYGLGAMFSLLTLVLLSQRFFASLTQRVHKFTQHLPIVTGYLTLATVAAISVGFDKQLLTKMAFINTTTLENALLENKMSLKPNLSLVVNASEIPRKLAFKSLPVEGNAPEINGGDVWLNSTPLTLAALKGKVVLVKFWTFDCINCRNTLPYVRAWDEKYRAQGLVIIGVHTPEYAFEKDLMNVKQALTHLQISYPVVTDNSYKIWRAYSNRYWPAFYLIDGEGRIRYRHFGEGRYQVMDDNIQQLLNEVTTKA